MRDGPADGAQRPGPADGAVPDRWQQRAGFSVFFDTQPRGPGELRWRTRLYHEETGDETTFPGSGPTDWVRWMLGRLGSAQPPSEPVEAPAPAPAVSMEIIDARLVGDPMPSVGDDSGAAAAGHRDGRAASGTGGEGGGGGVRSRAAVSPPRGWAGAADRI